MSGFQFRNPQQQSNNGAQDDSWKAQAFVNMYLPTKEGGRRKFGTVMLYDKKPAEKALIEFLKNGGEDALKLLVNKLEFNFQTAEASEGTQFDLTAPATGTNG